MELGTIVTKRELAEYLGMYRIINGKKEPDGSSITTYINRGKLTQNHKGFINTKLNHNKMWIDEQIAKRAAKSMDISIEKLAKHKNIELTDEHLQEIEEQISFTETIREAPEKQNKSSNTDKSERISLDLQLKQKNIELIVQKTKNLQIQEKKMTGELIRFDHVSKIVSALLNQFRSRLYQSGENIILELITTGGFDSETSARVKSKWKNETNMATSETVKSIIGAVEDIVKENAIDEEVK